MPRQLSRSIQTRFVTRISQKPTTMEQQPSRVRPFWWMFFDISNQRVLKISTRTYATKITAEQAARTYYKSLGTHPFLNETNICLAIGTYDLPTPKKTSSSSYRWHFINFDPQFWSTPGTALASSVETFPERKQASDHAMNSSLNLGNARYPLLIFEKFSE